MTIPGKSEILETPFTGNVLLEHPLLNKGTAFTREERVDLRLQGLLPPHIESLEEQASGAYQAFCAKSSDLEKHVYLCALQDTNEILFYRLLHDHLSEMMAVIYTPVVGGAWERIIEIYRRRRGLVIAYPERGSINNMLDNSVVKNVRVMVVTDGEQVRGLGDQGIAGMEILHGKLSLYCACGGIDPGTTLPVVLDVGTNNPDRLNDPLYPGWRHERISGEAYYEFVDMFIQAIKRKWPGVFVQFEGFEQTHAGALLERYRDQLCLFDDDIQGTATAIAGTVLSAVKVTGVRLCEHRFVIVGAGLSSHGITQQLISLMIKDGLSESGAGQRIFLVDRSGLLHDGWDRQPFQESPAQPKEKVLALASGEHEGVTLVDVIKNAKPTVLIGVAGQPGLFTQQVVQEMVCHSARPIIFPLSTPTARAEARPADLITWTDGKALVATGSPFQPAQYRGHTFPIAQCDNSYIFPGLALGILASQAQRVSDQMFMVASEALSACSPALTDPCASLLPPLGGVPTISNKIAFAVAQQAQAEGLADERSAKKLRERIKAIRWKPRYQPMKHTL